MNAFGMVPPNLKLGVNSNSINMNASNSNILVSLELKSEKLPPEIPMIKITESGPNITQYDDGSSTSDEDTEYHHKDTNSSELEVDSQVMRATKQTIGSDDELNIVYDNNTVENQNKIEGENENGKPENIEEDLEGREY